VSGDAGAEAAGLFYDELAQVKAEELRLLDLRRVDESSRNGSAPLSFGLVLMIGLGILGYIGTVAVRRSNVVLRTETLQSAIFNRANFSSIATDARGVIQIFNVGAERMLGYTAAEVMNKLTPAELADPQELIDRAKALSLEFSIPLLPGFEALSYKASHGIGDIYELTKIRKDGSRFPAMVSVTTLRDAQGAVIGYLFIGTDNTAKKRAGELLERQREEQQTILDSVKAWIVYKDKENRFLRVNKAFCDGMGMPREALEGTSCFDLYPREQAEGFWRDDREVMASGKSKLNIIEAMDGAKGRLWIQTDKIPVRDANGEITGIVSFIVDITERKAAEEELLALSQRLSDQHFYTRSLIESNIDAIVTCDPWGIITDVNKEMEVLTGCTRDELIGAPFKNYFTDPERAEKGIKQVLAEGRMTNYELAALRRGGKETAVSFNATTLYDRERKLQGVFVSVHDISEIKRLSEVKRLNEALTRSNLELEQFAYVASHDLQEPLRMVSSYTQLLAQRYEDKLDQDAKDFIGFAVDGANRMQRLIQDLLEYSRITSKGKAAGPLDTHDALGEAVRNVQAAIQESQGLVTNGDLPRVLGDRTQIIQVFQNLLGNALKFQKPGEPSQIHVSAERNPEQPGYWTFRVTDNGIGIEPRHFDRLFMIFQRLHGKREYPGTGIGLSLCKRIVERHGGKIWLESEAGKGTTFIFTLPAA